MITRGDAIDVDSRKPCTLWPQPPTLSARSDRLGVGADRATLLPAKRGSNKRTVNLRGTVNGLMYILSIDCQWRAIPKDLPPRSTLYNFFDLWSWDSMLDGVHHALNVDAA